MKQRKMAGVAGTVCAGGLLLLLAAAPAQAADWVGWLPESACAQADEVDGLINLVTVITGVTLVVVQALLVLFLIKYRARPGVPAKHTHGNHTIEMIWTVAPALILVFLALYQMELWARIKTNKAPADQNPVSVQVFAKQFEWNFRYPGPDGEFGTGDDLYTVKQLVLPAGRPCNVELRAMDVLHSFFLPNFRFKNDAVPGVPMFLKIPPAKLSRNRAPIEKRDGSMAQIDYWDIACAELCGLGHTTMSGRLYVVTPEEYERWLGGDTTVCAATLVQQYPDDDSNIWYRWSWQDKPRTVAGPPAWHRRPFRAEDFKGAEEEDGF